MKACDDVFVGTWKANHGKSKLDPNHQFQQATLRLERREHTYELKAEGIGADGQPCVDACSIHLDGKDHAHPTVQGITVIASFQDPNMIDVQAKQDGRVIGQAKYAVSTDGRTLTAETWGTDAMRQSFKTLIVFDRA